MAGADSTVPALWSVDGSVPAMPCLSDTFLGIRMLCYTVKALDTVLCPPSLAGKACAPHRRALIEIIIYYYYYHYYYTIIATVILFHWLLEI